MEYMDPEPVAQLIAFVQLSALPVTPERERLLAWLRERLREHAQRAAEARRAGPTAA